MRWHKTPAARLTPAHRADHDRRLELLARRLAGATSETELDACLLPLAEELHAAEIKLVPAIGQHVSTTQLLAGDPTPTPSPSTSCALAASRPA